VRIRAFFVGTAAAVAAALGLTGAGASADTATLFTTTSHLTPVAAGTTATVVSGTVRAIRDGTTVNTCGSSTLSLVLEQNDGDAVAGTFTSGSFSSCSLASAGHFPWRFTLRGTGIQVGSPVRTVFTLVTWNDVTATLWGAGPGTGSLVDSNGSSGANGASVREDAHSGSGICFTLDTAGTLSGPLLTDGAIDANYCLEGATATAWSLARTAVPTGPVTLYTTAGHTTRVTVGSTARLTGTSTLTLTVTSSPLNSCETSTLTYLLTSNTDAGGVQGTVTSASFSGCTIGGAAITATTTSLPWLLTITGTRLVSGGTVAYPNTRLNGFAIDFSNSGALPGSFTSAADSTLQGLYASQPASGSAPVCVNLDRAGDFTFQAVAPATLDGRFCFADGTAATWSLT
jgi:hypothetical protein